MYMQLRVKQMENGHDNVIALKLGIPWYEEYNYIQVKNACTYAISRMLQDLHTAWTPAPSVVHYPHLPLLG